ncbi:hypothetical protein N431DRAFT_242103 [Stipitochalara longipes BDJ]|nr:hypothetical protein N431DRAFT_242103 [Stipitochalara longipes BDJ]
MEIYEVEKFQQVTKVNWRPWKSVPIQKSKILPRALIYCLLCDMFLFPNQMKPSPGKEVSSTLVRVGGLMLALFLKAVCRLWRQPRCRNFD